MKKRVLLIISLMSLIILTGCFPFLTDLTNNEFLQGPPKATQAERGIRLQLIGTAPNTNEIFSGDQHTMGVIVENWASEDIPVTISFIDGLGDPSIGGVEEGIEGRSVIRVPTNGIGITRYDEDYKQGVEKALVQRNTINVYYGGAIEGVGFEAEGTPENFIYQVQGNANVATLQANAEYDYTLTAEQFVCVPTREEYITKCGNTQAFTKGNNFASPVSIEHMNFGMSPAGAGAVSATIDFDIINNEPQGFIIDGKTEDYQQHLNLEIEGFGKFVCNRGKPIKLDSNLNHVQCKATGQFDTAGQETYYRKMKIALDYRYRMSTKAQKVQLSP